MAFLSSGLFIAFPWMEKLSTWPRRVPHSGLFLLGKGVLVERKGTSSVASCTIRAHSRVSSKSSLVLGSSIGLLKTRRSFHPFFSKYDSTCDKYDFTFSLNGFENFSEPSIALRRSEG